VRARPSRAGQRHPPGGSSPSRTTQQDDCAVVRLATAQAYLVGGNDELVQIIVTAVGIDNPAVRAARLRPIAALRYE